MAARLQNAVQTSAAVYVLFAIRERRFTAVNSVITNSLFVITAVSYGKFVTLSRLSFSGGTLHFVGMCESSSFAFSAAACRHVGSQSADGMLAEITDGRR
jgi:hypothetical protein